MRPIFISTALLALLIACAVVPPAVVTLPAPARRAAPTEAPLPAEVPTFAPPAPPSSMFSAFPLAPGAVWTYSAQITYQDPNDLTKITAWVGVVRDTVLDKKAAADGSVVFTLQEDMQPAPPQGSWRQPSTFEYTLSAGGATRGRVKIIQWPLSDGLSWKSTPDFPNTVDAGYVSTGELKDCYVLTQETNPDITVDVFCPGTGFVEHTYMHHGTPQVEHFVLTAFQPGQ
jgi:hypothetical protein